MSASGRSATNNVNQTFGALGADGPTIGNWPLSIAHAEYIYGPRLAEYAVYVNVVISTALSLTLSGRICIWMLYIASTRATTTRRALTTSAASLARFCCCFFFQPRSQIRMCVQAGDGSREGLLWKSDATPQVHEFPIALSLQPRVCDAYAHGLLCLLDLPRRAQSHSSHSVVAAATACASFFFFFNSRRALFLRRLRLRSFGQGLHRGDTLLLNVKAPIILLNYLVTWWACVYCMCVLLGSRGPIMYMCIALHMDRATSCQKALILFAVLVFDNWFDYHL